MRNELRNKKIRLLEEAIKRYMESEKKNVLLTDVLESEANNFSPNSCEEYLAVFHQPHSLLVSERNINFIEIFQIFPE